jgi:glutathione synthase
MNKTYFQHFPEEARPRTLISRDLDAVSAFVERLDCGAVLKPLQGSGGTGVFLLSDEESPNLHQIVETLQRDGYVVVQERVADAEHGDVRLFVMNGEPLQRGGSYAALRRVNKSSDPRSNMHAGGTSEPVKVTDTMLAVAELARPKLVADGVFLAGLDIVGDKLLEVNVFSPGGLGSAHRFTEVDFADVVIEALERKIALRSHYGGRITNVHLATL